MMKHECKVTVIDKKCFADFQGQYLADKKSGPCPFFNIPETPEEEEWLAKLFREAGKLNYRFNDGRCDVSYNGLRNIPGN